MSVFSLDEPEKAFLIESKMAEGTKLPSSELAWYIGFKETRIKQESHNWRHKESGTVYVFDRCGLACTGQGTLALMVHYKPLDSEFVTFERQYGPFTAKFEPVHPVTGWERV